MSTPVPYSWEIEYKTQTYSKSKNFFFYLNRTQTEQKKKKELLGGILFTCTVVSRERLIEISIICEVRTSI